MGKPNYTAAKLYFSVMDFFAMLIFVAGGLAAVVLYQAMGAAMAIGVAALSGFFFLASIAILRVRQKPNLVT